MFWPKSGEEDGKSKQSPPDFQGIAITRYWRKFFLSLLRNKQGEIKPFGKV